MATKKQKHAAAVAKREAFLEEVRRSGLQAQEKDRQRREARQKQREAEARQTAFDKVALEVETDEQHPLALPMNRDGSKGAFAHNQKERFRNAKAQQETMTIGGKTWTRDIGDVSSTEQECI